MTAYKNAKIVSKQRQARSETTMACSDKELALREILGEARVDAALGRSDADISGYMAAQETFTAAERGLSALSLDTFLLSKTDGRAAAKRAAQEAANALPPEALDLLIIAVCARHRLRRSQ
jgi:hypothetical protein